MSYLAAFLGGILTLFAPCAAMLLPSFFAYAFTSRRTLAVRTFVFFLGLLVIMVPLGAFAGTLGAFIRSHSQTVTLVAGIAVMVLGVLQLFAVTFPTPSLAHHRLAESHETEVKAPVVTAESASRVALASAPRTGEPSAPAVFALGVGYGLAGVGCSGPILGAVLSFVTLGGSVLGGALLMTSFSLGMILPVAILAFIWDALNLSQTSWLKPRPITILGRQTTRMNIVSGLLFFLLGAILVFFGGYIGLPSLLSGSQQVSIESRIMAAVSGVPSGLFLALIAIITILAVVIIRERR
ncbi:MAG: cytochrome c biogenesis CcdA family protein [Actinomycetaceae bacterium]|nr:cytochrome c biogenesis CcdA family protein [Actinomycetaceae bacterium]